MKILKNIISWGIIIFALWFAWSTYTKTPCDRVINYDISFDDRFRISEDEFLSFIERAEAPWEESAGKELFRYVPGSEFKINLIFSPEQERLYAGKDISSDLDIQQTDLDSLQSDYQRAVRNYESELKKYQSQLRKYEQDVEYWNTKGGAPSEKYNALQKEENRLQRKLKDIENLRVKVNTLAEENNERIKDFNDGVADYNNLFSESKQFDAGNTDGTEINIYSYDGNQELMTLLTHEFGHVLGIDHVDDKDAVMYYLLNDLNKGGVLKFADIAALGDSCRLK